LHSVRFSVCPHFVDRDSLTFGTWLKYSWEITENFVQSISFMLFDAITKFGVVVHYDIGQCLVP